MEDYTTLLRNNIYESKQNEWSTEKFHCFRKSVVFLCTVVDLKWIKLCCPLVGHVQSNFVTLYRFYSETHTLPYRFVIFLFIQYSFSKSETISHTIYREWQLRRVVSKYTVAKLSQSVRLSSSPVNCQNTCIIIRFWSHFCVSALCFAHAIFQD